VCASAVCASVVCASVVCASVVCASVACAAVAWRVEDLSPPPELVLFDFSKAAHHRPWTAFADSRYGGEGAAEGGSRHRGTTGVPGCHSGHNRQGQVVKVIKGG